MHSKLEVSMNTQISNYKQLGKGGKTIKIKDLKLLLQRKLRIFKTLILMKITTVTTILLSHILC